jgi:hypothetical protein
VPNSCFFIPSRAAIHPLLKYPETQSAPKNKFGGVLNFCFCPGGAAIHQPKITQTTNITKNTVLELFAHKTHYCNITKNEFGDLSEFLSCPQELRFSHLRNYPKHEHHQKLIWGIS